MTVSPEPPGRQAEQQLVMAALAELIDRFGAEQLQDPGRVRSLLSDQLGAEAVRCRRELNLVVSAAEAKVPAALLKDMPASLDGLASRLATQTGLGLPAAYWAVLAWATPLGYAGRVDRPSPPFVAPKTATTPSPKGTTPTIAPTITPPPKPTQRPRKIVALAGLVVLLFVAVGTLLTIRNQPSPTDVAPGAGGSGAECPQGGLAIGFFGALTGPISPQLGINVRNGARLAVDQHNAANPACQVELVEFDSQGDPAQAPALAQKAAGDPRMIAIVGPVFSGESKVANPIFNEAGLPIVTPSATNPTLADNGWTIFHRAVSNDSAQGPAAAKYIQNTLRGQRIAVIDDNSEYGKGIADIVRNDLSGSVVFNDAIDAAAQDYSNTVNGVRSSGADVVFYGGYYAEAGRLFKQLRDAGVTATFVSDDAANDPQLIQVAGQAAAEGALLTCPCAPIENVRNGERFRSDYVQAFNAEPGTYSTEGYDVANVILQAITVGKTDRQSINDYLKTVNYQGITKQIRFDAKGEVADQKIYIYRVTNGVIVPVGPVQ